MDEGLTQRSRYVVGHHISEVLGDAIKYGFTATLSRLSGLLVLPLLSRVLSAPEYGMVDIVLVLVAVLSTLAKLSVPAALARFFISAQKEGREAELVSTVLTMVAVAGLFWATVGGLATRPLAQMLFGSIEHAGTVRLGCWLVLLTALSVVPETVLRLERRIFPYNLVNLIFTAFYVGLLFFFMLGRDAGVRGVFVAHILATCAALGPALLFIRRCLSLRISPHLVAKTLRFGLPLVPGALAARVNAQVDRFLLLLFLGLGGVAFFGAAARIARIGAFAIELFTSAWQPYAMLLVNSRDRNEVYRRTLSFYMGIFAIWGLAVTAVSPELLSLLAPEEYRRGYVVVPWLVGAAMLRHASNFTNLGILVSQRTMSLSTAMWAGAVLNAGLGFLLIRLFGLLGVGMATFVAEAVTSVILWRHSVTRSDIRFDASTVVKVVALYCVVAASLLIATAQLEGWISILSRVVVLLLAGTLIARESLTDSVAEILASGRRVGTGGLDLNG